MNNKQIFVEQESPFDVSTTVEKLIESAKKKKWKKTNVHSHLQPNDKSSKEKLPVQIIEICKDEYSGYVIKKNHEKFLSIIMMPCRISVYEKENGKTYVSLLNMSAMVTGLPHSENEVIRDASQETIEIVKSVIGAF